MKKYEIDMTEGAMLPKLIRFSVPVMLSGILQLAFNSADLIVVGRFAGDHALAAVGSNTALVSLIINVLLGLCTGTSVVTARFFGAKDENNLKDTVSTSMIIGAAGGVIFALIGILLAEPLLTLMGTPEEVLPLAALYLRIYFAGLPILEIYNFASSVLRAVGDTRRPLYYLFAAGVLNVGLNLFFVIVLHMSVAGVGLATVISQCLSAGLTLLSLIRTQSIYRFDIRRIRFSKAAFSQIIRIGLPAGIQGSLFSVSNVIIQSSVNSFGPMVMAGNSAAISIEAFIFTSLDAVNQSSIASVSQNMGARKYDRTKRAVLCCLLMEFVIGGVFGWAMRIFARPLIGIFTQGEEAIAAGVLRVSLLGVVYFSNGMQHLMGGVMRSHGYGILPTCVTFMGICGFRIIWVFTVFAHFRTMEALYISYPVSWVITAVAQSIFYLALRRRAWAKNEERMNAAQS